MSVFVRKYISHCQIKEGLNHEPSEQNQSAVHSTPLSACLRRWMARVSADPCHHGNVVKMKAVCGAFTAIGLRFAWCETLSGSTWKRQGGWL